LRGAPAEYALFRDGLTSSWQLDLFGRVRRAVEAADAATLAAVENRHGVALAAVAELALRELPAVPDNRRRTQRLRD
jgi:outer membrane protein TolC